MGEIFKVISLYPTLLSNVVIDRVVKMSNISGKGVICTWHCSFSRRETQQQDKPKSDKGKALLIADVQINEDMKAKSI